LTGLDDAGSYAQATLAASVTYEPAQALLRMRSTPRAGRLCRTFALDISACACCGDRRRVLAYLTSRRTVRSMLEHLDLAWQPPSRTQAQGLLLSSWC
jgi:hypothetical protein